jgi:hypothetical protein
MKYAKNAGIALVALVAMSIVVPSLAAAREFTADSYPATLRETGHSGETAEQITTTAGNIACKVTAHHGTLSGPATAITMRPSFSECTAFGFPATVDVNECNYVLNVQAGASEIGDLDISCPSGKTITVTAISAGTVKCTVHIAAQSDISGTVKYTNVGSGSTEEITTAKELSGLDYSHTKGTGLGACTAGSATNGTLSGKSLLTARNEVTLIHVGLFMS